MDSVLRGAVTYVFVFIIFRLSGKRSLAQITTFDAVLLLIISEATQAALLDNDNSMTNSVLLILTMVGLDVGLSHIKQTFPRIEKVIDGRPSLILDDNGLRQEVLNKERVAKSDILHAARSTQGLQDMESIQYAVLEATGDISIVPKHAR